MLAARQGLVKEVAFSDPFSQTRDLVDISRTFLRGSTDVVILAVARHRNIFK
jgi:hypothetical protein